jgi:hypothetical protein
MNEISVQAGCELMRKWGVDGWEDPGATYVTWDDSCVFALVQQDGFLDIHMAMDANRLRECRAAGAAILRLIGHLKLRAVILPDRPRVCNYAARMGFTDKTTELLKTIDGSESPFFVMWRKPGEYNGRSN